MTLSWNLIAKHLHPHAQLQSKIREKIAKLEVHLQHFPPETVHLLVHVERHPKRERFSVALTLRLPSNILHSHKTAADPVPAFDQAMKALRRELLALKVDLRREPQWKPEAPRKTARAPQPVRFAPEPTSNGPQSLAHTLAELVERHYGRLVYHVQRQLWRAQLAGLVPKGAIAAHAVVDDAVQQALAKPQRKPEELSYRLWLFALARRELRRRLQQLRRAAQETVSLEDTQPMPDQAELAEGYDAEQPLAIIEENLEPGEAPLAESLPDNRTARPDAVAMEHDLVDFLHRAAALWPAKERAVFELHFLEGFETDEVAMLETLTIPQARELIAAVQARLRQALLQATDLRMDTTATAKSRQRPSPER